MSTFKTIAMTFGCAGDDINDYMYITDYEDFVEIAILKIDQNDETVIDRRSYMIHDEDIVAVSDFFNRAAKPWRNAATDPAPPS